MLGYILIDNKEKMKYQIGKRYKLHSEYGSIDYNRQFDDACHNFWNYDKIYKIKVYDDNESLSETRNFKILQEINYKDLLNSKNKYKKIISAIKNKEESVLNDFVKSDSYYEIKTIIKSKVHKYIDIMITNKKYLDIDTIISLIKELGRNKDLNNFVNRNDELIKDEIAHIGRPQDLDVLINDKNMIVIENVLLNGRTRDINKYVEDIFLTIPIIKTGINKYLDKFINNKNVKYFIAEQGRKCDLDIFVHDKDEGIKKSVARHGYDEHLDILEKENNPNINYIINELRGKREL